MDLPSPEWVVAVVVGVGGWIVNKIWNNASDDTKKKTDASLSELSSLITQVVLTMSPNATPDYVITQLKGLAAIQMAKAGLRVGDNYASDVVAKLVDAAIAEGVMLFVKSHPAPTTLTVPAAKAAMSATRTVETAKLPG